MTNINNSDTNSAELTPYPGVLTASTGTIKISDCVSGWTAADLGTSVCIDSGCSRKVNAIKKILDWLEKEHAGQVVRVDMCRWSHAVSGFEIVAEFTNSVVINSIYSLDIYLKVLNEPGKRLFTKTLTFATDSAVYDWFGEHDIAKFVRSMDTELKAYFAAYSNVINSLEIELAI